MAIERESAASQQPDQPADIWTALHGWVHDRQAITPVQAVLQDQAEMFRAEGLVTLYDPQSETTTMRQAMMTFDAMDRGSNARLVSVAERMERPNYGFAEDEFQELFGPRLVVHEESKLDQQKFPDPKRRAGFAQVIVGSKLSKIAKAEEQQ